MINKFLLLTWKNWLLQWRHPVQSMMNIVLPLIFCGLLVVLRNGFQSIKHDATIFPEYDVSKGIPILNSSSQLSKLIWSPCGNSVLESIMTAVARRYAMSQVCAKNSLELELLLKADIDNTLAGVDFGDYSALVNNISKETVVTLRFPAELRSSKNHNKTTIRTWRTDLLYPELPVPGPRNYAENTGPDPYYYKEGFLTLQHGISTEIMKYHLRNRNGTTEFPKITMRRFPHPAYVEDEGLGVIRESIGASFYIMFISIILGAVKDIADEREKQLKETLKVMGIPSWLHWIAWFSKTFTLFFMVMALVVVFLTVPTPKILVYTNPFLFFTFLMFYAAATTTFCFLICVLFSKAKTAMIAILVFWYVSFVPFMVLQHKVTDMWTKLFAMLGLNTTVCFGIRIVIMFEAIGGGLQFNNIFVSPNPVDNLKMGHIFGMLAFDTLLYFVLAIYLEGLFPGTSGIPKTWYYPCVGVGEEVLQYDRRIPESATYQRGPIHAKTLIRIRNLTKIYQGQTVAVQDLSLDIFEGQITVLLGHHRAGKTTTLSMLTGTIPFTSGTVIINSYNLPTNVNKIRNNMSFCPQQTVLFCDLTVREHLYFFNRLKGTQGRRETNEEIEKYLELLDLVDEENMRTKYLSTCNKRKLCVAIALCGKRKICILDEPTSGMDPISTRILWDFLRSLRKNKSILLSTQSMEEASYLGDRIAILSNGKLQCCGTSAFLNQRYDAGYHLVVDMLPNCDTLKLTDFIKKHIPSIKLVKHKPPQVTYLLDRNNSMTFSRMLEDLESHFSELAISNFEIAISTIDEVLAKENWNVEEGDPRKISPDKTLAFEKVNRLTGYSLTQNQFIALIMKKAIMSIRSWIILVTLVLLPICSLVLVFLTSESRKLNKHVKLKMSLDVYDHPAVIVSSTYPKNVYYLKYIQTLQEENRKIINWGTNEMVPKILEETKISEITVRKRYILGSSFSDETNTITGWYNSQPYHSSPLSLQYILNSILRYKLSSKDYKITFVHHPLPYPAEIKIMRLQGLTSVALEMPCTIGISIAIVSALYVIFCIKERISNSKHLQFVSGVRVYVYWFSVYVWDLCSFLMASICIITAIFALDIQGLSSLSVIGPLFILFTLFGLAMLPMMYLFSFYFQASASAFYVMALLNMLLGPITFIVYQTLSNSVSGPQAVYNMLDFVSQIVPHYAFTSAIYHLNLKNSLNELCNEVGKRAQEKIKDFIIADQGISCGIVRSCCGTDEKYFGWYNHGIGKNLSFLTVVAVLLIFLLLVRDYGIMSGKMKQSPIHDNSIDSDVLEEKSKVNKKEINSRDHCLVLQNLTKFYQRKLIVNQLSLGVRRGECFGLLGVNGVGKTTTLRMLTGNISLSYGDAWIYGRNVNINTMDIYKYIGYCPQSDALLNDLTGKETLILYCLLRGITFRDSKLVIQLLAREFEFENDLDKLIRDYSGGTKRKLSIAIALIGDPPVLILDEPTIGTDLSSKRKLWKTLANQRDNGKCILLASNSLEECEALCTRLGIMVNGTLKCLGTPSYLKQKFSLGYTLTIRLLIPEYKSHLDSIDTEPVIQFIGTNFPMTTLKEHHQNILIFFIATKRIKWSSMFGLLEEAKRSLNIEDYSIAQSSLQQMFLHLSKLQNND